MRFATLLLVLCASSGHAASAAPDDPAQASLLAAGQRIYREGMLPNGQMLRGVSQAGVTLSGKDAACTTCHRRSGYGSSEGPIEVRPITGPALFSERAAPLAAGSVPADSRPLRRGVGDAAATGGAHQSAADAARAQAQALRAARTAMFNGTRSRPTYDDATLTRAIGEGIDVTGRPMDATMPRYALDAQALRALTAYLHTLSVAVAPGVSENAVHFATVMQPGTSAAERAEVVEVLEKFFSDRNRGLRAEVRREQAGQVHLGRVYRDWVLHVWDLQGPSTTWREQLEAFNRGQPVFAMVSGIGKASWQPIHEFSEQFEVPCILPQADVPVVGGQNFYTVYLSQGVILEAQALAKFLQGAQDDAPVVQVYRRENAGSAAAAAFRQSWTAGGRRLSEHELSAPVDATFWRQLARDAAGATVVLWLSGEDLRQAQVLTAVEPAVKAVYLSSGLTGGSATAMAADPNGRVRIVYPQDPPEARAARLEVVKRWLLGNGIAWSGDNAQLNAYLAATVTGMMVSHSKDTYSREFLIERMEHRLGNSLESSIYPHLSLGPGQRFASKGSYIASIGAGEGQLKLLSDWIVP